MNPKKCIFGVSSEKLLGFIVSKRGIETDPNKAKAIAEMPPSKNIKELRGLIGWLQFIRRFISQHSQRCRPFYELLKARIKIDPNKAKAIVKILHLKNIKELRGLIGWLQFIRRFISQHSQRCHPFYELLTGGAKFE